MALMTDNGGFDVSLQTNLVKRYALATIAALAGCGARENTIPLQRDYRANAASGINGESIAGATPVTGVRTHYDEQRHSPLDQINLDNVDDLSLAWYWNTGTKRVLARLCGRRHHVHVRRVVYGLGTTRKPANYCGNLIRKLIAPGRVTPVDV